jgi:hypothetical protein
MSDSRAHTPSIAYQEMSDPVWDPTRDPLRTDEMIQDLDKLTRESERETPNLALNIER